MPGCGTITPPIAAAVLCGYAAVLLASLPGWSYAAMWPDPASPASAAPSRKGAAAEVSVDGLQNVLPWGGSARTSAREQLSQRVAARSAADLATV